MPDLEAEYDNRGKVPDHADIMAGWQARSAAFRQSHADAALDVPYGDTPRQALDIFWPEGGRSAPLAMFIHGGYWQALDRSWFSHLARGFVENGIALALPSYDLCPQVRVADIVAQMRRAAAFLMQRGLMQTGLMQGGLMQRGPMPRDAGNIHAGNIQAGNIQAGNIHVTGHSAGGHLAAMLLATDWQAYGAPGRVTGAAAISGLFDLEPLLATRVNAALGLDAAEARRLSPVHLPKPAGMLYAFVGALEGDEYTRQSRIIADAWDGVPVIVPAANHFTVVAPLEDADAGMMRTIRDAILAA